LLLVVVVVGLVLLPIAVEVAVVQVDTVVLSVVKQLVVVGS
jgi:hypothetical protein